MTRPRNGCAGLVELESNERGSPILETISMPTTTAASSRPKPPFLSEWIWSIAVTTGILKPRSEQPVQMCQLCAGGALT